MGEKTFLIKEGDTDMVSATHIIDVIQDGKCNINNRNQYILNEPLSMSLDM